MFSSGLDEEATSGADPHFGNTEEKLAAVTFAVEGYLSNFKG